MRWLDGAVFKGNNTDGWTATGAVWPTTQKTTASKFYGYADFSDLTETDVPGIAPTIGANSQSFTYTLGDGEESTLSNEYGYTDMYNLCVEMEDNDGAQTWFELANACKKTEQAYVVEDKNTLPDLLVTANDQEGTEGDDGKFSLHLKHALSNLVIKAKFVADDNKWVDGMEFYIEWIRIHGLYTSGTYTFGDGNGWTFDSNNDKKIVYEKFFGMSENAKKVEIQSKASATTSVNYTTLISLGEFMMIPQSFTPWTSTGKEGTATGPNGVYIEFAGYLKNGNQVSWDGLSHFLPLSVTNATFVAGKSHTLVVDLTYSMKDDGVYDATPAEVGGGARMASYFEE